MEIVVGTHHVVDRWYVKNEPAEQQVLYYRMASLLPNIVRPIPSLHDVRLDDYDGRLLVLLRSLCVWVDRDLRLVLLVSELLPLWGERLAESSRLLPV